MAHNQILTKDEVLKIARNKWHNIIINVVEYSINSFSEERLGFMSMHRSMMIKVEDYKSKAIHTETFFVKCLPPKDDPLAMCMMDMGVFNREIAFYRDIVPALQKDYKDQSWAPICYGITENAMILEDLRNRNFALSPSKTFNLETMKSLLSAIARMQSASIVAEKRLGKPLNEAFPEAFDMQSLLKPNGFHKKWYQTGVDLGIKLAKELGLNVDKFQTTCDRFFDLIQPEQGQQNVITHGDLWSNNIMFDDKKPPFCTIIDFQWTRYCPPAQEVIMALHFCNNQEFRNAHQDKLLKYYYDEMTRILKKHEIEFFSWDDFLQSVKKQTVIAKIVMVLCFPSIFMDGDVCEEMMNDPEKFMEFMFSDKAPMTLSLVKKGGEYEKRVMQAVIELVELYQSPDFE